MCNKVTYRENFFNLKIKILKQDKIGEIEAKDYIEELEKFKILNEDDFLELKTEIEFLETYLQLKIINSENEEIKKQLEKIDKNLKENEIRIKKQNKKLEDNTTAINNHDKRILEMMGIFLAVFSLIGVNLLFFFNIGELGIKKIVLLVVVINITLVIAIKVIFGIIRKK